MGVGVGVIGGETVKGMDSFFFLLCSVGFRFRQACGVTSFRGYYWVFRSRI